MFPVYSTSAEFLDGDYLPPVVVGVNSKRAPDASLEEDTTNLVLQLMVVATKTPERPVEETRQNKKPKLSLVDSLLSKYDRPLEKTKKVVQVKTTTKKANPFKK